jgi:hypothetical protein
MKITNYKLQITKLFWWAFVSIVAVVLVEINALLGLAAAIIGGIILGVLLFSQ